MNKPIVHFIGDAEFVQWDEDTVRGYVLATDHPRLGSGPVRTSKVLTINEDGSFETLDTLYIPKGD